MASFSITPVAPGAGSAGGGGVAPVQAGVLGGQSSFRAQAAPPQFEQLADFSGAGLDSLLKFGTQVVGQQLKTMMEQQAMDGAMRALQGESAAEIADENPFGTVFGDSAAVKGARMVEVQTASTTLNNAVLNNMDHLRAMDPEQFRSWYTDQLKGVFVGDDASDALIAQSVFQQMPAVADVHTRQHFQYKQEQAGQQWLSAIVATGDQLRLVQEQYDLDARSTPISGESLSTAAVDSARASFAAIVSGPTGMTADNYKKFLGDAYTVLAQSHNWHALNLLEDANVLSVLPPDAQEKLKLSRIQYERQNIASDPRLQGMATSASVLEVQVRAGMLTVWDDVVERFNAINGATQGRTGQKSGMLDNNDLARLYGLWSEAGARLERERQRALNQELDGAQQLAMYQTAFTGKKLSTVAAVSFDKATIQAFHQNKWNEVQADPAKRTEYLSQLAHAVVNKDMDAKDSPVHNLLVTGFRALEHGRSNPSLAMALNIMDTLERTGNESLGPALIQGVVGTDTYAKIQSLRTLGFDLNNEKDLNEALVFMKTDSEGKGLTQNQWREIAETVRSSDFVEDAPPYLQDYLSRRLTQRIGRLSGRYRLLSTETLVKNAIREEQQRTDSVLGVPVNPAPGEPVNRTFKSELQRAMGAKALDPSRIDDAMAAALKLRIQSNLPAGNVIQDEGFELLDIVAVGGEGAARKYRVDIQLDPSQPYQDPVTVELTVGDVQTQYDRLFVQQQTQPGMLEKIATSEWNPIYRAMQLGQAIVRKPGEWKPAPARVPEKQKPVTTQQDLNQYLPGVDYNPVP